MHPRLKLRKQARHDIPLDNHDALVPRQHNGNQGPVVAEGEVPRHHAAGGKLLDLGQRAGGVVDFEVDEGIRGKLGAVGRVEVVRDVEGDVHLVREDDARARGCEEEIAIGLGGLRSV